jgi:hypothetical protein
MYKLQNSSSSRLRSSVLNTRLKAESAIGGIKASIESVHLLNISDYALPGYFAESYTQATLIED